MLDLSLVELLLIAVAALVVIGPKDLPKALAAIMRLFKQAQSALSEIRSQVNEIVEESGVNDTKKEINTIIDDHGRVQQVYDISDFLDEDGGYRSEPKRIEEKADD